MENFLLQLLHGLQLGTIYALIALGYTMVYGIIRLINFAHADLFMIGAYTALFVGTAHSVPFPVLVLISMLVCGTLGVLMEKLAYRPLRHKPRLSALITALGVSLFLENFLALPFLFGPEFRKFPELIPARSYQIWPRYNLQISRVFAINLLLTALLLLGLWLLVHKTLAGKQMRAVAQNKNAAALMGINVDRVISLTFFLGTALAGASGIMYGASYGILQSPYLGIWPGWKAFIAAVLGGIGSLPGALLGGLLMGITESYANSVNSNLGYGTAFAVLILVLLVRPHGILGSRKIEKV